MTIIIRPLTGVTFEEALKITPLLDDLQMQAENSFMDAVRTQKGAFVSLAAQGMRAVGSSGTFLAKHSARGANAMKAGEAVHMTGKAGGKFADVVSKTSGKLVGKAKLAKGAQAAVKLANIATAVITVAHVISGIDTARKIEAIGKDVRFLRDARRISQLSRLEAVYRFSKEILSGHIDDGARRDLHRLCFDLFELRAEWRREIMRDLENVEDKTAGFLESWFNLRTDKVQLSHDAEKAAKFRNLQVELHLMHFSIVLQMALALAAGRNDAFLAVSLPDEMKGWQGVREILAEKTKYIRDSSTKQGVTAQPVFDYMDSIISRYAGLVSGIENPEAMARVDDWIQQAVNPPKKMVSAVPIALANLVPARMIAPHQKTGQSARRKSAGKGSRQKLKLKTKAKKASRQ